MEGVGEGDLFVIRPGEETKAMPLVVAIFPCFRHGVSRFRVQG